MPAIPPSAFGIDTTARLAIPRVPFALGIVGQSNERGNVLPADAAAFPQAFGSLRQPWKRGPFGPDISTFGGMWPKVIDDLFDWGYDTQIVNGAIGGSSFLKDWAGIIQTRQSNAQYPMARPSSGYPDLGDAGAIIGVGGRIFQCVAGGATRLALNDSPFVGGSGGGAGVFVDTISGLNTGGFTASTAPDFTAAAIGGTVVDGGLTWLRLNEGFFANASANANVMNDGASLYGASTQSAGGGRGFDGLALLARINREVKARAGGGRRLIYIANGQTDLGTGAPTYAAALKSIGGYCLRQGDDVMIGLTNYSAGSSGATVANYDALSSGMTTAIAALQALFPGRVSAGANLYQLMGTTGPMGGGVIVGTTSGATLTVSSVTRGAVEVGQSLYDLTTAGAIAKVVSGSGTTWQLDTDVGTRATRTFNVAGSYMQPVDVIHMNGGGAITAGGHIANAIKAVYSQVAHP
jgi:hypothetical protein